MKRYSRREIIRTAARVAAIAPLAAACGPGVAPSSGGTGAPAASGPRAAVQITYWGSFSGNLGKAEKEVVDKFNASQQDVVVDYQFQGSYEDTAQKLTAALQAKTAPDVVLLSDVWWFKFYLNKVLEPLGPLMKEAKVDASDYVDVLLNEGVRKGETYWLPFARSTPIFYYNKDAWKTAGLPDRGPKSWDEFTKEWLPKLKPQGKTVFAHPGAASYIAWLFQGVIWQHGGEYSDAAFNIKIAEPGGVAAGEFYRSGVKDGWAIAAKDMDADFRTGQALSIMGSTAGLAAHEAAAKFQVGAAFLPEGPKGFGCCTGGSGMSILRGIPKEKQQAAMKFIAYATGEATTFWSQNTGYMPVRKSAIAGKEMTEFYAKRPNFKTVVDQLPKTRAQDAARVYIPNGDQIIGKGLERITINGEPADVVWKDVAATLSREAQPVLRSLKAIE